MSVCNLIVTSKRVCLFEALCLYCSAVVVWLSYNDKGNSYQLDD